MRHPFCLLAAILLALSPAVARADDTQLWAIGIIQGTILPGTGPKPMVWMEVQPRIGNDISHLNNFIIRPGFGIRIAPDFNLLFGYQFQRNTPLTGRDTNEHRMYQQLTLPLYRDPESLIVTTRLRLEQRSVEQAQDLGWRFRTMVRAQLPLHGRGTAGPLLWSEALIGLNDTDWGQHNGVGQVRAFAGGLVPLSKRLNLEAGYMAQFDRTPGRYRTNHVVSVLLNYRIGD